jgi:hypothetical protein
VFRALADVMMLSQSQFQVIQQAYLRQLRANATVSAINLIGIAAGIK